MGGPISGLGRATARPIFFIYRLKTHFLFIFLVGICWDCGLIGFDSCFLCGSGADFESLLNYFLN